MKPDTVTVRHPRGRVLSSLLALSGWVVLWLVVVRAPEPARVIAVFGFILICPGAALIRLLHLKDLLERAVLGLAIGLSLAALTGEAAAVGQPAQARLVLVVLASICSAAALAELIRGMRARS